MPHLKRLKKAFLRRGIALDYNAGVYRLQSCGDGPLASAKILLPEPLPLEEKAVLQLMNFAAARSPGSDGRVCAVCATPDFHPGHLAPVGSVVATTPDMAIPQSIGTDINCGMQLLATPIALSEAERHQSRLEKYLVRHFLEGARDAPASSAAFRALFDKGPEAFLDAIGREGIWAEADLPGIERSLERCIGLSGLGGDSRHAPDFLVGGRELLRDPCLGTIGSGNHFVEFQVVDRIYDRKIAYERGLQEGRLAVMIHSGSRDVGFFVGGRWMDMAKQAWPSGQSHPKSGLYALCGPLALEYLQAMGVAARYAWLNRAVLAEMARRALREIIGCGDCPLVVDAPHNIVLQEHGMNIHRKGSTPAGEGVLALIPGSMGDYSYLVTGLGNAQWLWSCSHGAGRSMRRQQMRAGKMEQGSPQRWRCLTLRQERLIEEAPSAYKSVGPVISAQEEQGMIQSAVRLRPWLTIKA